MLKKGWKRKVCVVWGGGGRPESLFKAAQASLVYVGVSEGEMPKHTCLDIEVKRDATRFQAPAKSVEKVVSNTLKTKLNYYWLHHSPGLSFRCLF